MQPLGQRRLLVHVEAAGVAGGLEEHGRERARVGHVEGGEHRAERVLVGVILVQAALQEQIATEVVVDLLDQVLEEAGLAVAAGVAAGQTGAQRPQVAELEPGVRGAEDELLDRLGDVFLLDLGAEQEAVLAVVVTAESCDAAGRKRVVLEVPGLLHPDDAGCAGGGGGRGHAEILSGRWTRVMTV